MILLISPHAKVRECSEVLSHTFGEATDTAESLDHAMVQLRSQEYSAVVLDQTMAESDPDDAETTLQHLGTAIPIFVNFGISNIERLLKEVRSALMRRRRDERAAREHAERALRSELNGIVTAMLLSCELALEKESSTEIRAEKVRSLHELVLQLRAKLAIAH